LEELPVYIQGVLTSPESNHLCNTNPECKKLSEEQAQLFHCLVEKLPYLSKRTRQDIQIAVAFLCTREKKQRQ